MNEKIVVGHTNPDTDSAVSALIFSLYLTAKEDNFSSCIAGKANKETEFVFSYFKKELPFEITKEEAKEKQVFLVDHNDISQSVACKENICGVLDHHLLSGIKTNQAIFFRVEPLGSTSTLIYKMIKERKIEIKKEDAGLLLAGIISDTLNLNSPTTTSEDIDFYYELSQIAEIDADSFSQKMFEAKSDFSGKSVRDIIRGDMKEYSFGGKRVAVGVSETTSLSYFKENKNEIIDTVKRIKKEENFDIFFFCAVDIINKNTWFFPSGEKEKELALDLFKAIEKEDYFLLEGVSSRKKEIAPPLSEHYEK